MPNPKMRHKGSRNIPFGGKIRRSENRHRCRVSGIITEHVNAKYGSPGALLNLGKGN